jgi:hypothetical protein
LSVSDCGPRELFPTLALLVPVDKGDDLAEQVLRYARYFWGKQQLFLDVGREQRQVHDLSDPRPSDVSQSGEVCVVSNFPSVDDVLAFDGKSHQPGDSRNLLLPFLVRSRASLPARLAAAMAHRQRHLDLNGPVFPRVGGGYR